MTSTTKFANNLFRVRSILFNELVETYGPSVQKRKARLIEVIKKKAEQLSKSEFGQKMRVAKGYYRLEMAPPNMDEMEKLKEDVNLAREFMKLGCYKLLTVKQAWLLFLVGLEVGLWFFLGETIGKFHIVGYKV